MTTESINQIVDEVLRRLKKKVLLVLTNAGGYKKEIQQRLASFNNLAFDVIIAADATSQHCQKKWAGVGALIVSDDNLLADLNRYQLVLFPFFDAKTLADLNNGIVDTPETKLLSYALMQNIVVKAFDYNCDPQSELNSIRGLNKNPAYSQLVQQNLAKARQLGLDFCTMAQFESEFVLANQVKTAVNQVIEENKFITLNDILNKRVSKIKQGMKLTALAADYLKQHPLA